MPQHRRTTNLPGADERAVKRLSRKPMHVATDYAGRQISIHERSKVPGLVCLSRDVKAATHPADLGHAGSDMRTSENTNHPRQVNKRSRRTESLTALTGVQSEKATTRPTSSYQTGARALLIVAHDVVKKGESRSPP
jgi:hypothetical protein